MNHPAWQARQVAARGLTQHVLTSGPVDGIPVLLIHGNCSSAQFWTPLLRHLPPTLRLVAPDLRGYGHTELALVDARRGLRDFADDVAALLAAPELFGDPAVRPVVGHSMGGGVAMQLLVDHPDLTFVTRGWALKTDPVQPLRRPVGPQRHQPAPCAEAYEPAQNSARCRATEVPGVGQSPHTSQPMPLPPPVTRAVRAIRSNCTTGADGDVATMS